MKRPLKKATVKKSTSAKKASSSATDILKLILSEHKPLKKFLKILKNNKKSIREQEVAFEEFAPMLSLHSKAEELSFYIYLKKGDDLLRTEGFEGDVEHGLADQMIEEARRTDDKDLWAARVKVLAELVEHHLTEEENDVLPSFKQNSTPEDRFLLGKQYLQMKANLQRGEETEAAREQPMQIRATH